MSDFKMEIERGSTRRKIVLSFLIGHKVPGLQGVKEEEFENVTDAEIEEFLVTMTREERLWSSRRYAEVFQRNAHASQLRLHPPKGVTVGVSAGKFVDFDYDEAGKNSAPLKK